MFTWTDQYGTPVTYTPTADDVSDSPLGSDVAFLPILIAAARAADDAGYCPVYDEIARTIGGPTRDELREAGLLDTVFTVEGTRTVTLTVRIPFSSEYTAARPGDVRRNFDADELGEVSHYDIRDALTNYAYDISEDDIEIDSVERP